MEKKSSQNDTLLVATPLSYRCYTQCMLAHLHPRIIGGQSTRRCPRAAFETLGIARMCCRAAAQMWTGRRLLYPNVDRILGAAGAVLRCEARGVDCHRVTNEMSFLESRRFNRAVCPVAAMTVLRRGGRDGVWPASSPQLFLIVRCSAR